MSTCINDLPIPILVNPTSLNIPSSKNLSVEFVHEISAANLLNEMRWVYHQP
jgi:hypothetical protein